MMSLLQAVETGRLIELPDNNKDHALQILASVIEAIPGIPTGVDLTAKIGERERAMNTGIGSGWACPHARIIQECDMLCAVGWSPGGIDYGAPDGKPVHMVVMYLIPENQKNVYLKELSTLAHLVQANPALRAFGAQMDLHTVRSQLLDVLSSALESPAFQAKAKMIRLETKPRVEAASPAALSILPFSTIVCAGRPPLVLAQDADLVRTLEACPELVSGLARQEQFAAGGFRILVRSAASYRPDRTVWDCLALREPAPAPSVTAK